MDWHRLPDYPDEQLWRGTVLRSLVSEYPYEAPVDFMLVSSDAPCGLAVVVSTGSKAGSLLVQLPSEARGAPDSSSVSRDWLAANWEKWVTDKCPPEQVLVSKHYSPGVGGSDV